MKNMGMKGKSYILATVVLAAGCSNGNEVTRMDGFALGTVYQVSVKGPVPANLEERLDSLFAAVTASMSVFAPDSRISRLNRGETDSLDEHLTRCIETADDVSRLSGGLYDITVKPLRDAYGFGNEKPQENPDIDSLLETVGYDKLSVCEGRLRKSDPRVQIDLNSIAKGYTVDRAGMLLEELGVREYLVDIGGEIYCRGTNASGKEWTVGIESPFEGNYIPGAYVQTVVRLSDAGLATSGNYRNFRVDSLGRRYTHIINPLTGANTRSDLLSATVMASSCMLADAYGTMLMAVGYEKAVELLENMDDAEALLIRAAEDGGTEIYATPGMKERIVR